jgi:hypothetical protein
VVLYCIEYRITDIGPYNEVGLTVLAAAPGDSIPANYVVNVIFGQIFAYSAVSDSHFSSPGSVSGLIALNTPRNRRIRRRR